MDVVSLCSLVVFGGPFLFLFIVVLVGLLS